MKWALVFAIGVSQAPAPTSDDEARKRRIEELLGPATASAGDGERRPDPLRLRDPILAAGLGGVAGFGTGSFYAGRSARGVVLSGVDTALVLGLGASLIARESGRDATASAALFGSGLVISRIYQAVFAYLDALKTNEELEGYSFVPLPAPAR